MLSMGSATLCCSMWQVDCFDGLTMAFAIQHVSKICSICIQNLTTLRAIIRGFLASSRFNFTMLHILCLSTWRNRQAYINSSIKLCWDRSLTGRHHTPDSLPTQLMEMTHGEVERVLVTPSRLLRLRLNLNDSKAHLHLFNVH